MPQLSPHELCHALIEADSEEEVLGLLREADYWDRQDVWRFYGDIENNYSTMGNQQSRPEAALVEKLVNSVDARLVERCLHSGIPLEGDAAPANPRQAVARFFDPPGIADSGLAGLISEWPDKHRREIARGITLAATGARPKSGHPCFTISDCGEGQMPRLFPDTLLSLHRSNKFRIPFVQGKYNMGGTGALRFCGTRNLQLVLSRRRPSLVHGDDPSDPHWGFTIVRRASEGGKNTVYSYLAPEGAHEHPRRGNVLHFPADSMPIFPAGRVPYNRESDWGTLIKLYDYQISKRSHILRRDGLLNRLDLLLAEIALPVRLHECREGYRGHEGSYANNLTGFRVRLEDNKADNLEFEPSSCPLRIQGESMTATIFAFKKAKADTYRNDEGIVFTMDGQTHGHLPTDFFRRKRVGMSYLRHSILVVVDCSTISPRAREDLFMNSRDRLANCGLRTDIERELERILRRHDGLRKLRESRRREEVESRVADDRPLEDVLRSLLKSSPPLSKLFLEGVRLSTPFKSKHVAAIEVPFQGRKHPTYFRFKGREAGAVLTRDCELGRRARITFETDAEAGYFSRDVDAGRFALARQQQGGDKEVADYSLNLQDGIATLNLPLPETAAEGDRLGFIATVDDPTSVTPFVNRFHLLAKPKTDRPTGPKKKRKKNPSEADGDDRKLPSGITLPIVREVGENEWLTETPAFDAQTALRIKHAGGTEGALPGNGGTEEVYDFFVNIDNAHLKTFLKFESPPDGADLVRAQFKYGLVLLGLALIHQAGESNRKPDGRDNSSNGTDIARIEDDVEAFSRAAAAVLLPVIRSLGDLDIADENDP